MVSNAKFSIKTKFRLGAAVISLLTCTSVAIVVYYYLKDLATREVYKETEIFIGTADATRRYVKDVLRPTMGDLLTPDRFIPHAMSTTYVGREIMNRLGKTFSRFQLQARRWESDESHQQGRCPGAGKNKVVQRSPGSVRMAWSDFKR